MGMSFAQEVSEIARVAIRHSVGSNRFIWYTSGETVGSCSVRQTTDFNDSIRAFKNQPCVIMKVFLSELQENSCSYLGKMIYYISLADIGRSA